METFGQVETNAQTPDAASHAIHATSNGLQGMEWPRFTWASNCLRCMQSLCSEALPAAAISTGLGRPPAFLCGHAATPHPRPSHWLCLVFDLAELLTGQRSRITAQSQWLCWSMASANSACWWMRCMVCTTLRKRASLPRPQNGWRHGVAGERIDPSQPRCIAGAMHQPARLAPCPVAQAAGHPGHAHTGEAPAACGVLRQNHLLQALGIRPSQSRWPQGDCAKA